MPEGAILSIFSCSVIPNSVLTFPSSEDEESVNPKLSLSELDPELEIMDDEDSLVDCDVSSLPVLEQAPKAKRIMQAVTRNRFFIVFPSYQNAPAAGGGRTLVL